MIIQNRDFADDAFPAINDFIPTGETVTIVNGGTGASTAEQARINLGVEKLLDFHGIAFQDFPAGTITGTSVTLTDDENGTGYIFDNSNIINNSAVIVIKSNPEAHPYTGITKLFSTKVSVSSHTGDSVTLDGIPHSSWGDLRIYYRYTYNGGMPVNYEIAPKYVSGLLYDEVDNLFITEEEFDAMIDQPLLITSDVTFNSLTIDKILFDTTAIVTHVEGQLHWDDDNKTLELDTEVSGVALPYGKKLVERAVNKTGVQINIGTVVYVNGAQGFKPTIALADADVEATSDSVLGIVSHNISNNDTGYVIIIGQVKNLNTTGTPESESWAEGDELYISSTAGAMTKVKPTSPIHSVYVAMVLKVHTTEGIITVNPSKGLDLYKLHDVDDSLGTPTDKSLLYWDDTAKIWKGSLGLLWNETTDILTINNGLIVNNSKGDTGDLIVHGTSVDNLLQVDVNTNEVIIATGGLLKADGIYGSLRIVNGGIVTADSVSVALGTITSGDVTDTETINQTYFTVQETGKYEIDFTFINVLGNPRKIEIVGRYEGNAAHEVEVMIWNYDTVQWDDINATVKDIPHGTVDVGYEFDYPDDSSPYVDGSNEAQVRIVHNSNFVTSHYQYVDYIAIQYELLSLTIAETYYVVDGLINGITSQTTLNAANGTITIVKDGTYNLGFTMSFFGTIGVYHAHAFVNGVIASGTCATRTINHSGDIGNMGASDYAILSTNDILDVRIRCNQTDAWIGIANFSIHADAINRF